MLARRVGLSAVSRVKSARMPLPSLTRPQQQLYTILHMKVALIQAPLQWEDPAANRTYFENSFSNLEPDTDLIVLPEMFTTGFTMNPHTLSETMDGQTVNWMKSHAKEQQCAITGSLIIRENDKFFNRLLFVHPTGDLHLYDKRHLFSLAGEDKVFTKGETKLIVEYMGWKICLLICYDLRFPVFSRNVENYDLIVYVANWPQARTSAWDVLLKARAIENMCYVIGVNRIGSDANEIPYIGHSQIIDELGNIIIDAKENEGLFNATLDKEQLYETRNKLAFLDDRDSFTLT